MDGFTWRRALRSLLAVNEGPWRWRAGIIAACATGLPVLLFMLAGERQLALTTTLGSFTALYSPQLKYSERIRVLPLVGAGLLLASLIGVAFAGNLWLTILGVMIVAAASCLLILGLEVGPPGPMMFILVTGVSGYLSTPADLGGVGVPPSVVLLCVAAGAVSSLLVVAAPLLVPSVRRRQGPPRPLGTLFGNMAFDHASRWIAFRVLAAVFVASAVSPPLGITRAYWVVLAAVAILQASHWIRFTLVRALQRFLGTLGGVLVFLLLALFAPEGLWLVLVVVILQFMIELVIAKNYGLAMLFLTPLALFISTAGREGSELATAGERVGDTLFGAVIAVVVLLLGEWLRLQRLLRR